MSTSGPLLSIVVPTYNRDYCLARTLDSALNQTYANVEVIVVDDGSKDKTDQLIADKYGNEPRLRYIKQKNGGVSSARNNGLRNTRGEFIALLDSDDVWHPWKAELQIGVMQARPDLVMTWTDMDAVGGKEPVTPKFLRHMYGAYQWFPKSEDLFGAGTPLSSIVTSPSPTLAPVLGDRKFYSADIFSQMILGNLVHTSTVILRRAVLDKVKIFREDLHNAGEDYDFHLRTCHEGPVGYLDVSSILYERGLTDHIASSKNGIYFAQHYLVSITPYLEGERHRLTLTDADIRGVLAKAHRWIGQELFERGERAGAVKELALSLRYKPWQPRTLMFLAAAPLPPKLRSVARTGFRAVKKAVGASAGT
jgi:GT2 family glycosyltransferase